MRLTLVYPCVGKRIGKRYIKSWQMEPLAPAVLASLTPGDVDIRFYDDRLEPIPFDEPTDLVAISVETYTAKRAYQIASLYRKRGVPVVMGGFHPTLVPEEVMEYAESVVVGEAEGSWKEVINDFKGGNLKRCYQATDRPSLAALLPDRSIFQGKRYLPITLIEAGRGCHLRCEFCSVQSFFNSTQVRRPTEEIIDEIKQTKRQLVFFVDDNITSNMDQAKEFFHALIPLQIRWVSQASINAAHDKEFLELISRSGCQGLLIGFETFNSQVLRKMQKSFNTMAGGYEVALSNFRRFGIRLYPTFIIGYDGDDNNLEKTLHFALKHRFYVTAFNHPLPFPGTPLYKRLQREGRLLYDKWWLDPRYRYGMVPFVPTGMTPEAIKNGCVEARRKFYSFSSIFSRSLDFQVNSSNLFMWAKFFGINWMMRRDVLQRKDFPLGDEAFNGELLKVEAYLPSADEERIPLAI